MLPIPPIPSLWEKIGTNGIRSKVNRDVYHTSATVAAAGTTQGTATALTKQYNFVTSGSGGVKLPTPANGGLIYFIDNDVSGSINIYPDTGGKIDGGTTNAPKAVDAGKVIAFVSEGTTEWLTIYGSGAYIPSGTTLPTTGITDGQLFTHKPTGRSVWMKYNATLASWVPIFNEGATTIYIDSVNGTDDQNKGFGTGTDAYATIQYANNQLAGLLSGNVTINIASGSYSGVNTIQGKAFTGNYTITYTGDITESSQTATGGVAGTVSVNPTVVKTSAGWTVDVYAGELIKFTSGTNNGQVRVVDSNTSDTLTLCGPTLPATPANGDTFSFVTLNTTFTGRFIVGTGQDGIICHWVKGAPSTSTWAFSAFGGLILRYSKLESYRGFITAGNGFKAVSVQYCSATMTVAGGYGFGVQAGYCEILGCRAIKNVTIANVRGLQVTRGSWVLLRDGSIIRGYSTSDLLLEGISSQSGAMIINSTLGGPDTKVFNATTGVVAEPSATFYQDTAAGYADSVVAFSGCTTNWNIVGFFSSSGALRRRRTVEGSVALVSGAATVTLTNSAVFSSATNYTVCGTRSANTNTFKIANNSGSSFTITSSVPTDTDTVRYIAYGD